MSYRDDLQALVHRHNALDAEVVRTKKERDDLRSMIDSAQARLRLPVLDNIRVAAPCAESWAGMSGDARVRHCTRCNQNVYNLSEMTREEAESLVVAKEGKLCVRYFRRAHDNTIITRNCPVGAQRRRRWMFGIGVVVTLIGALFCFLTMRKKSAHILGEIEAAQGGLAAPTRDGKTQGDVEMGKFAEPPRPEMGLPERSDVR
jgi:hypothetical protein